MMSPLRERDGDLINHWYILALEAEVSSVRPLKRDLYDRSYVLFRDEKGSIAVLIDRCLHRSAQLSLGKVANGELRCPYHGWAYDRAGRVTDIPSDGASIEARERTRKLGWCTPKVPFKVQDGCVWVWPGEANLATGAPPWRFPKFEDPSISSYFMITDFENDVEHLVQNFMDVPHTVFVHAKWFRNRSLLKVPVQVDVGQSRVKVTYDQPGDSIGFSSKVFNPRGHAVMHTDEFIFPNLTRVDYTFGQRFFIINSQCSPISAYKSRVYTWIAYDVGLLSPAIKPIMRMYTRKVITQDVEIMKNQGDNLKRFPEGDFRSTQADELHLAITRLRQMGRENRQAPTNVSFTRKREFWI